MKPVKHSVEKMQEFFFTAKAGGTCINHCAVKG